MSAGFLFESTRADELTQEPLPRPRVAQTEPSKSFPHSSMRVPETPPFGILPTMPLGWGFPFGSAL
jgi:hypothetical protein